MAALAMPLKETNCLGVGGSSTSAVSSSMFREASAASVGTPGVDEALDQHSPQMISTKSSHEKSSLRPKSISGAELTSEHGNCVTSARIKRPANNNSNDAGGDQATDLTLPAKVPKREMSDVVPGTSDSREYRPLQNAPQLSLGNRTNSTETNCGGINSMGAGSAATEQLSQLVTVASRKFDALSPPFVSGNSEKANKEIIEKLHDFRPRTSSSANVQEPSKILGNAWIRDQAQQQGDLRSVGKPGPQQDSAMLLSGTAGAAGIGLPAYFHTEMHQHQHTHMHQYPPFLSPYLGAATAGNLPGITGMVGLPPAFAANLPAFPLAPQVPGLAVVPPTQVASNVAQAAPKKRGKWCAMHVQIAWDIYNKTASRREKKEETVNASTSAGVSVASTSSAASSNALTQRHSVGRSSANLPTPTLNSAAYTQMSADKARPAAVPDVRDQKRREKERHGAMNVQRVNELDGLGRAKPIQNGVQSSPNNVKDFAKLADHRSSNGSLASSHCISSILPPSSSAVLPLRMEAPPTLPLFQDGLLSRQQHSTLQTPSSNLLTTAQLPTSSNSLSSAAALAAAAIGGRPMLPTATGNFIPTSAYNNATSNLALAAVTAAAERLRPITPSGAGQHVPFDAYRALMGLDAAASNLGRGYDAAMLRPPFMLDPLVMERERELLRLQQSQLLVPAAGSQDHLGNAAANPLASMIDLERAMNRPMVGLPLSAAAANAVNQQSIPSAGQFSASQSVAALAAALPSFNPQFLGGLDGATAAAAAAAAAAALYSNGFLQRDRLELDQQMRLLGGVAAPATANNAMDPLRFGLLGASAGNPLLDSVLSARVALPNAAVSNFPSNLGLNFGLGAPASAQLPSSSVNLVGSLMNGNMLSPFSNSLEQLARQKRDALLATAAAAIGSAPATSLFQKR